MNSKPILTGTKAVLASATEDTPYDITTDLLLTGFTDANTDTLSAETLSLKNPQAGTFSAKSGGGFTFTPTKDFFGLVEFTYKVSDGKGGTADAASSFAVIDVLDILTGTLKRDILTGDAGQNLINGGRGSDMLTGGAGADTFAVSPGTRKDRITDFVTTRDNPSEHDRIDLTEIEAITGWRDLKRNHMEQADSTDVVIRLDGRNTLTIENAVIADLGKDDFLF